MCYWQFYRNFQHLFHCSLLLIIFFWPFLKEHCFQHILTQFQIFFLKLPFYEKNQYELEEEELDESKDRNMSLLNLHKEEYDFLQDNKLSNNMQLYFLDEM